VQPEPSVLADQRLQAAEHKVELDSAALKKELRLIDLVGIQILNIVGLFWVGTAGRLGPSHVTFWIPAVLLFYIPSGVVVAHLGQEMPLEGGLYQWAKLRFSPAIGFLVAMNLWVFYLLVVSQSGVVVASNVAYALGPGAAWVAASHTAIILIGIVATAGVMLLAWRGLAVGKWVNNFGGYSIVLFFVAMIAVALPRWFHGASGAAPAAAPLAFTLPALSVVNLNLLGKMGFGAFSGFDGVGIFAGECRSRNVAKVLRQSVLVAGPLISAMFIAGTASVLAYSRPDAIDLVAPITQMLNLGAPRLAMPSAFLMVLTTLAQTALGFSAMIRLPMVAGWDHLLPDWFSRLDPRFRTPVGSILVAGAVASVFAILANLGTGNQEAFQLLTSSSGILFGLTYLVMFAIPLVAAGERPSWGVRLAALSGFLMTLLFVVLSVFPIIDVPNRWLFTLKVVAVVAGLQGVGIAYYRAKAVKRQAAARL
jgi:glutamate:GABA antiporter